MLPGVPRTISVDVANQGVEDPSQGELPASDFCFVEIEFVGVGGRLIHSACAALYRPD